MTSTSSINFVGFIHQPGLNRKPFLSWYERKCFSLRICRRSRVCMAKPDLDCADPDWKIKFQENFDRRFDLPHLNDVLEVEPRPTTFSLKSRVPLLDGNFPPEKTWNGYVNEDDRTLLKVIKFQIVLTLEKYGVKNIVGIHFGYRGFFEESLTEILLSPKVVENINLNLSGGSLLGVSRGGATITEIVDIILAKGN